MLGKYSEETLVRNYRKLDEENKKRVSEFLFHVLYVQRAEQEVEDIIEHINDSIHPDRDEDGVLHCSLCRRAEGVVKVIHGAGTRTVVCYDCIDLLSRIKRNDLGI